MTLEGPWEGGGHNSSGLWGRGWGDYPVEGKGDQSEGLGFALGTELL